MEDPLNDLFNNELDVMGCIGFISLEDFQSTLEQAAENLVEDIYEYVRRHKNHPEDFDINVKKKEE